MIIVGWKTIIADSAEMWLRIFSISLICSLYYINHHANELWTIIGIQQAGLKTDPPEPAPNWQQAGL